MRLALPNSEILIHQPLGGAQGQATDIILAARHIEHTRKRLNSIPAMNTGQDFDKIAADTELASIFCLSDTRELSALYTQSHKEPFDGVRDLVYCFCGRWYLSASSTASAALQTMVRHMRTADSPSLSQLYDLFDGAFDA